MTNPTKVNAYKVIGPDALTLDHDLIQSIDIGGVTIEKAEHVEGNWVVSTPSLLRAKAIHIKLMTDTDVAQTFFIDFMQFDQETGGFRPAADVEFDMTIQRLALDNATPIWEAEYSRCRIFEDEFATAERKSTDNQMHDILVQPTRRKVRNL